MNSLQAALYARVSSAQQAEAHTVASQVVALRERIAADGLLLPEALPCIDEGDRGATLVRPALERLRDVAAAGAVDRLYVHSPDRLARKYAYQVLLPTFKGSECSYRFFVLKASHTRSDQGPAHRSTASERAGPQRPAHPLDHLSGSGPGRCGPTRPPPPPPLGSRSGLGCLEAADPACAETHAPAAGCGCRRASR
jgi:Resolvase, N terminal domain